MQADATLARLMALDGAGLTDLLAEETEAARQVAREAEVRFAAYLEDLTTVLAIEGGAGVRVVRHCTTTGVTAWPRWRWQTPQVYCASSLRGHGNGQGNNWVMNL